MSWFDSAKKVIDKCSSEQALAGITDKAEIIKAIDAAYPFGMRKSYPYKAWLRARKEFIAKHGGVKVRIKQDDLFFGVSE